MPPMALRILPSALSALPSLSSLASPVTFATSLTLPLAYCAEPLIRSLSIAAILSFYSVGGIQTSSRW
jgi:hypothetical protein